MLAKIISKIRQEYDHIHFHIFSGQAEDVSERLDSGLLDLACLSNRLTLRNTIL